MAGKGDSDNLSYSQRHAGDEFHALCCTRCAKDRKNKPSVKYCTVCSEYFCKACLKNHNSYPVMSKHPTVDTYTDGQSSRTTEDKLYAVPTEFCPHHPLKLMDMYCRSEDIVGCSVCFNLEHKLCNDTHYIPKFVVEGNDQQRRINQICREISKATKNIDGLQVNFDKCDKDFEKSKNDCKQEIDKYRQEINDKIDDIERRTLTELETKYNRYKQYSNIQSMKLQEIKSDLKRYLSDLVSEQVNLAQKFVLAILGQRLIKQSEEMKSKSPVNQTSTLKFKRNTDILAFLLKVLTLGMLSSPENQDTMETGTKSKQPQQSAPVPSKPTKAAPFTTSTISDTGSNRRAKRVGDDEQKSNKNILESVVNKCKYNMRKADDRDMCQITSSCILDENFVLLIDQWNWKLKLVDSNTYSIISSLSFDTKPLSVCRVSNTEAAVCLFDSTIQFVSTCNNLVVTRSLRMKHDCICITVSRDRMYICDDRSLYIYKMNGTLKKKVKESKSGDKIFSDIHDITISDDHNMIHIVDFNKGVITLDINGEFCWGYSSEDLDEAHVVCTDGSGNVLVCGYMSHSILQLGLDENRRVKLLSKYEIEMDPTTISYDRNNNKLIVGGCDNITVLTLR
ncbi:hypothetical protein ACF0H5_024354 [Mactra antiquata]